MYSLGELKNQHWDGMHDSSVTFLYQYISDMDMSVPDFDPFRQVRDKIITQTCQNCDDFYQRVVKVQKEYMTRLNSLPLIKNDGAKQAVITHLTQNVRPKFYEMQKLYTEHCHDACRPIQPLPIIPSQQRVLTLASGKGRSWKCHFRPNRCNNPKSPMDLDCCL